MAESELSKAPRFISRVKKAAIDNCDQTCVVPLLSTTATAQEKSEHTRQQEQSTLTHTRSCKYMHSLIRVIFVKQEMLFGMKQLHLGDGAACI